MRARHPIHNLSGLKVSHFCWLPTLPRELRGPASAPWPDFSSPLTIRPRSKPDRPLRSVLQLLWMGCPGEAEEDCVSCCAVFGGSLKPTLWPVPLGCQSVGFLVGTSDCRVGPNGEFR